MATVYHPRNWKSLPRCRRVYLGGEEVSLKDSAPHRLDTHETMASRMPIDPPTWMH